MDNVYGDVSSTRRTRLDGFPLYFEAFGLRESSMCVPASWQLPHSKDM